MWRSQWRLRSQILAQVLQEQGQAFIQVFRDVKVPATGGASVAEQGQESLEAAGVNIAEVGRVLKEGPGGLAVDGQSLPGGVINDALGVSRDKCKLNRRGACSHDWFETGDYRLTG